MRAGDTVFHRPSGETWLVASVTSDGHFYACGWPETRASFEDVELKRACTDGEHRGMLHGVAASKGGDDGYSARASCARHNLLDLDHPIVAPECVGHGTWYDSRRPCPECAAKLSAAR